MLTTKTLFGEKQEKICFDVQFKRWSLACRPRKKIMFCPLSGEGEGWGLGVQFVFEAVNYLKIPPPHILIVILWDLNITACLGPDNTITVTYLPNGLLSQLGFWDISEEDNSNCLEKRDEKWWAKYVLSMWEEVRGFTNVPYNLALTYIFRQ